MTHRRVPRWAEVRDLVRPARPYLSPARRRLAHAHSIADLRRLERRSVPRAVFDYVDGAAEDEVSLSRARAAFEGASLHPRVLRDVSRVDASTTILGRPAKWPFVFAPTGFTRMMNHHGEPAVAAAAERFGVPYTLSTMGTTSIEELADRARTARKWFQLYLWQDTEASSRLVSRADRAGFETLVLTVDTPVAGARLRDARNGLTVPPSLTWRTLVDGALHPRWWFDLLTTEPLRFASFDSWPGTVAQLVDHMFDPSVTERQLNKLRDEWPGNLVVKGIQTVDDAERMAQLGVDAIVLSTHGGRQLDRVPAPLELLPETVARVGDKVEVYIDSGILSGADIVVALALGARACLIGRAYLYGLMVAGQPGVEHAASLLTEDITRTMRLLGVTELSELSDARVSL